METQPFLSPPTQSFTRIDPATTVGAATLKVADLERSLAFYTRLIGLQILRQGPQQASLGAGGRPILHLIETPGARPQPANTTGLYHAAILFPSRRALALKIAQLSAARIPLGQADHLVSEAFYLSDPDENGLELYRDRPRSEWVWRDGRVEMAVDPVDLNGLLAEIDPSDPVLAEPAAPADTRLGHIHLRAADIPLAEQFYHDLLGFDVTAKMPGAIFLAAGGYHHHLGLNTWQSRGGRPPQEPSAGLAEFSLQLPTQAELERLAERAAAAGVPVERTETSARLRDPFQNAIRLTSEQT